MNTFISSKKIDTIAIGGFDGIHIGHQKLFDELGEQGAVVIINMNRAKITPRTKRCRYITHRCIFYDIDDIKHLDGKAFIQKLQADLPSLRKIVVGYDFHFGKSRGYHASDLKKFFEHEVKIIREVTLENLSVHSGLIREFILRGAIKRATRFLGHTFMISAKVIKGQGLGKKHLVPTLNLSLDENYILPKNGVYASYTHIDTVRYKSVSFIGHRVSVDGSFAIETHLLDVTIDFTPQELELEFIDFIRENKKFESLEKLKEAIGCDIDRAKALLHD